LNNGAGGLLGLVVGIAGDDGGAGANGVGLAVDLALAAATLSGLCHLIRAPLSDGWCCHFGLSREIV